jgi:hypothetical protein
VLTDDRDAATEQHEILKTLDPERAQRLSDMMSE